MQKRNGRSCGKISARLVLKFYFLFPVDVFTGGGAAEVVPALDTVFV